MDEDLGRYSSAKGWQPKDPWKKRRDKEAKEQKKELEACDTMLELRSANAWMEPEPEPPAELFGPLWRTGELAVLLGEPQIGKSLLAVQIANELSTVTSDECPVTSDSDSSGSPPYESGAPAGASPRGVDVGGGDAALGGRGGSLSRISSDEGQKEVTSDEGRGTSQSREFLPSSDSSLVTRPSSLTKVLYIDFQHTAAQWTERYSYRTPTLGRFVMPYEFPENFERAAVNWDDMDDEKFKRDPLGFAFHSIFTKIEKSDAKIVIIDDLTLGGVAALARNAPARIMHTLKVWTARKNLSMLVISNSPPGLGGVAVPHGRGGRSGSPPYQGGVAAFRRRGGSLSRIPKHLSLADSIFSLNPSTFGPQYRYIKPLRSPIPHSKFEIQNSQELSAYELTSSTPLLPDSSTPLLPHFFKDLGPSNEEDHLRDYAAEAKRADRESRPRYLKSAKSALIDGLMDGSYMKYLKG